MHGPTASLGGLQTAKLGWRRGQVHAYWPRAASLGLGVAHAAGGYNTHTHTKKKKMQRLSTSHAMLSFNHRAGCHALCRGPFRDTDRPGPSPPIPTEMGPSGSPGTQPGASNAALITNLLPLSTPQPASTLNGVYVGEGLPPVPAERAEKIRKWEYVEMAELLPEFWNSLKEESSETRRRSPRQARQVTDIHTWMQCFATYAGVLDRRYPEAIAELMAYLICLVRVSRDFQGVAWVRYDAAFHRQASITGNRQWSKINLTLYSLCFAGRAQTVSRCKLCMDTSHVTKEYALFTDPDPELPNRVNAIENAVLALTHKSTPRPGGTTRAMPSLE